MHSFFVHNKLRFPLLNNLKESPNFGFLPRKIFFKFYLSDIQNTHYIEPPHRLQFFVHIIKNLD